MIFILRVHKVQRDCWCALALLFQVATPLQAGDKMVEAPAGASY